MTNKRKITQYWVNLCYLDFHDGIVRATCGEGSHYIGYKFSHEAFNSGLNMKKVVGNDDMLQQLKNKGVYFLIYKDGRGDVDRIYVGKAGERADEELGVINRIKEHSRDKYKDWDEAVVLTWRDNSLNATRVSFLEHEFHEMIKRNFGEKKLANDITPSRSMPDERELYDLERFAAFHAPHMIVALGYTFLAEKRKHVVQKKRGRARPSTSDVKDHNLAKAKPSTFEVKFVDEGVTIKSPLAHEVFVNALVKLGLEDVAGLGFKNLVSKRKSDLGSHQKNPKQVGPWFINTHSSTNAKIQKINSIANKLGVKVQVTKV